MKVMRSDADWSQAACIDEPREMFFAECPELIEQAKAICRTCPIIDECADWALSVPEEWGVWAALDPKGRHEIRRGRRQRRTATPIAGVNEAECGTESGYQRHRRVLGEDACEPCREANAAAKTARHKRTKGRAA